MLRGCVDSLEERVGPAEAYFGYQPLRRPRVSKGSEFMMIYAYVVWRYGSWEARFDEGLVPAASINRKADAATAEALRK